MVVAEDWVPESLLPNLDEIFARQGLVPLLRIAGMATEQLLPSTTYSSKLNCVSVNNLEMRRAVADINAISNNQPLAPFREALELDRFWQETVFGTLGFVGNQPVSTAITFLINNEFYLGWVATLPDYRNQAKNPSFASTPALFISTFTSCASSVTDKTCSSFVTSSSTGTIFSGSIETILLREFISRAVA
jgi:hypothetical protein